MKQYFPFLIETNFHMKGFIMKKKKKRLIYEEKGFSRIIFS